MLSQDLPRAAPPPPGLSDPFGSKGKGMGMAGLVSLLPFSGHEFLLASPVAAQLSI